MKKLFLFIVTSAVLLTSCYSDNSDYTRPEFVFSEIYHNHNELEDFLSSIKQQYPGIVYVEEFGLSEEGRSLLAVTISNNPEDSEMEPSVRFTGDIHGNELISGEILIKMIEYITANSSSDKIKNLIDTRKIVFIPMLNPDGAESGRRYNANNVDLNRNFDEAWTDEESYHGPFAFSERESLAFRDYSERNVFHLSVTYHSGQVVVNMPFDYVSEDIDKVVPVEYDLVKKMALIYSGAGTFLQNPDLMTGDEVTGGTVNGGDWYIVNGSLQDWSYLKNGCMDLTVEVAKRTPQTEEGIDEVFLYNRDSMLAYIEAAGRGVCGRVTDGSGNPVAGVKVSVEGGDLETRTNSQGYYHKVLLSGNYLLKFEYDGVVKKSVDVSVTDENTDQKNIQISL